MRLNRLNPLADIRDMLPRYTFDVIFDVGANIGQSALAYLAYAPGVVHCFEPCAATCAQLRRAVKPYANILPHKFGLGDAHEAKRLYQIGSSDLATLRPNGDEALASEKVPIQTLDRFCELKDIPHINYLKIDTEGWDLHVLRGAQSMLTSHDIDFVEVEASMHPGNTRHAAYRELCTELEGWSYAIFGVYEQISEQHMTGAINLRRANFVFVSPRLIKTTRRAK